MKTNYQTFPNLPIFPLPWEDFTQLTEVVTQYECFIRDVLQWKQDSQTELREIIKACEQQPIQGENVRIHLQARTESYLEILGEVLGEKVE